MNNARISKTPLGVRILFHFILQPLIVSLKSIAYSTPFFVQTTPATPHLLSHLLVVLRHIAYFHTEVEFETIDRMRRATIISRP